VKIIIVGTYYPLRGGIAHYNALLASELRKKHFVDIITFKRQYPKLLFPGKTQQETGPSNNAVPAPELVDSINPMNWPGVAREIRRRNPDLLIFKFWLPFFGPCFGTIAKLAKRKAHTKVLFICDNVIPHEHRPGDILFTKYAFRQVDYFVVQSDAVERDLQAFWPAARYRKVPHPVYNIFGDILNKQESRNALGIHAQHVLLFFGYVRAYKGLHILLEAMARLKHILDIHLLVVGEFYDDEKKYRTQIQELALEQHVTIHADYVPNDQVSLYFSAADAVVLPYVDATQSGIVQIAYNFEKPVIATRVGGLGEVVLDNITGFVVPPNDPRELADSILRFFSGNRVEEFTLNIRQEKGKYTWEAMGNAIESLMSS